MKILQLILNFFNAGKVDFYDLRRNDIRVFVKGEDDLEESNQELTAQDTSPANHGQDHLSPPSSNGAYSPFSPPTHRMHSVMGLTSIRNQLTWYYQLKDVAVRQEYYEFTGQKKSLWFLLFSNLLFTIVLLPFSIATLVYSADDMTNWQLLSSAFSFGFVVIGIVLGWIVYVHNKYTSILFPQITPTTRRKWINIFQHVYIAVMELYMVNIFIRQSLIPFCKHDETGFHNAFSVNGPCGSVDVRVAALVGNGLLMLSIPLLYFFNIPETRIEFTWTSFTFCFVTFALVCAYLNSVSSILLVGVWQCACMFAVADAQLRNVLLFVTNQELKETIVENERMADELHANELRHMIGNVAHDLKTVSVLLSLCILSSLLTNALSFAFFSHYLPSQQVWSIFNIY